MEKENGETEDLENVEEEIGQGSVTFEKESEISVAVTIVLIIVLLNILGIFFNTLLIIW